MGFEFPPEARLADRRRLLLTLGVPYALLFLASLVAWPWRALEIPGVIGTLTPPSFLILAATVAASTVALRRRLPLSMITWLPAGQGAIVLLATGFFTVGPQDELTGLAFILAYGVVFLIVLAVTTVIASHGGPLAISFISLFVFTQAARFPVFEADAPAPIEGATLLTLAAALLAAAEIALMVWLARRLVEAADVSATRTALWIVGLVIAHGLLASWEDPALNGALAPIAVFEQMARWLMFAGIQLGMATVLIRFRRAQFREEAAQSPERAPQPPEPATEAATSSPSAPAGPSDLDEAEGSQPLIDRESARQRRRPTPRRRRR